MSKPVLPEDEGATAKAKYRVTNGPDYDRALVRRGDVTVWFDAAFPVPDHTRMSRRAQRLQVAIPGRGRDRPGPVHLVVDSTGLQVYGAGEWTVRPHGVGKRRAWRKVHVAVDGRAKDAIGVEVTTVAGTDGEAFEGLLDPVEGTLEPIDGDGASAIAPWRALAGYAMAYRSPRENR